MLHTKWLGEAWEDYTTNHQKEITSAFKRCGMFNAMDGSENDLVEVRKLKNYKVPAITEKRTPLPKKRKVGRKY